MAWLFCFHSCFSFFFFKWWRFRFLDGVIPAFHHIPHHTHCGYSIVAAFLALHDARLGRGIKRRNPNYVGLRHASIMWALFFTFLDPRTMLIVLIGSLLTFSFFRWGLWRLGNLHLLLRVTPYSLWLRHSSRSGSNVCWRLA